MDLSRLNRTAFSPNPETQPLQTQLESLEESMEHMGPVQAEEMDLPTRKQPGRLACASIKESRAQALQELPDGFCVCEAGRSKAKRLQRLRYCWMVPGVDYFVYSIKLPPMPPEHEYEEECKRCSAALFARKLLGH